MIRPFAFAAFAALAACRPADAPAPTDEAEAEAPAEPETPQAAAERLVRGQAGGGDIALAETRLYEREGVSIVCGSFEQPGAGRQRYIAVGGEEAFIEPQMQPGEMDRAFDEFCRDP